MQAGELPDGMVESGSALSPCSHALLCCALELRKLWVTKTLLLDSRTWNHLSQFYHRHICLVEQAPNRVTLGKYDSGSNKVSCRCRGAETSSLLALCIFHFWRLVFSSQRCWEQSWGTSRRCSLELRQFMQIQPELQYSLEIFRLLVG